MEGASAGWNGIALGGSHDFISFAFDGGTTNHASFVLDLPVLLPAFGYAAARLAARWPEPRRTTVSRLLLAAAMLGFWGVAGGLYFDLLSLEALLGPAGKGNHFMWNSGVELLGLPPFFRGAPSYRPFLAGSNLFALALFLAAYPAMLLAGYRAGLRRG